MRSHATCMIDPKHISVVVQGAVVGKPGDANEARLTLRCLESIRVHLPGAEIILSTWKGSDVRGLPFDTLVESDDPGALSFAELPKIANNVNRQIVSTKKGLREVTRGYTLKMRTDMVLHNRDLLQFYDRFRARSGWSILRNKVVASTIYSRVPGHVWQWPYHPGDWFFFGLREDVLNIWDIPEAPEPETTLWFAGRPRPSNDVNPQSVNRYAPEQYIWLTFLRKHMSVRCDYQWDLDRETIEGTEKSFASNLVLVSPKQAGLSFEKYPTFTGVSTWLYGPGSCYDHRHWRHLYEKHCECKHSVFGWHAALRLASVRSGVAAFQKLSALRARTHAAPAAKSSAPV